MGLTLAIVNPVAGGGRAMGVWCSVAPWLTAQAVECAMTRAPGEATALAREAVTRGAERLIAVGGDGTVSEVAAGLVGLSSDVAVAIVPAGSGNDFSRALGVPRGAAAAAHLALSGAGRWVDVGWATTGAVRRTFVNVAGCGFDAEVVRQVALSGARSGTASGVFGGRSLAYLAGVLGTLARVRPRRVVLSIDGVAVERSVVGIAVANGTHYGGGLRIAPRALLDDGLLDVCVVGARSPIGVLALLPWLYVGAHGRLAGVELTRARSVRVEALDGAAAGAQADGELIGELPIAFEVQPAALRVVGAASG